MNAQPMVRRRRISVLACVALIAAIPVGCSALATMVYVFKGRNIPPEFEGLKEKRVVVVCRPLDQLEYSTSGAASDIATGVGRLLQQKVKKIDVVDADDVAEWVDENTWDDFTEIGEALEADLVIGIDLARFKLLQSQTLYQGRANLQVKVYDMQKDGEIVFQKDLPEIVFPPNRGIYTQDMLEDQFGRIFVGEVAEHVGRLFYPHDMHADFAKDSSMM